MKNVTIIGSGSFGCALAYIISKNNHNIKIWSYSKEECDLINNEHRCMYLDNFKLDERIKCYTDYEDAIKGSEYIILVSPSRTIRNICKDIKKYINNQEIILASKGMEGEELLSDVIKEELDIYPTIISGPSHAEQVIRDIPTYVEYSGNKEIKEIFENDKFRLIYNDDYVGIEVGGILKNIVALEVGVVEGLGYDSNTVSYIITEGLKEIKEISKYLGAKENTIYGLSGLGDLLTTSLSLDSRNKRAGILFGKGKKIEEVKKEVGMTIEGLEALKYAYEIVKNNNLNCYIIDRLYKSIYTK